MHTFLAVPRCRSWCRVSTRLSEGSNDRFIAQLLAIAAAIQLLISSAAGAERMAPVGTKSLLQTEDPAEMLVNGVDRFLLRQIDETRERRHQRWRTAFSGDGDREEFIGSSREQLREILGLREPRISFDTVERVEVKSSSTVIAAGRSIRIERIRWPVLADPDPGRGNLVSLTGEGILLTPAERPVAVVIGIPDADQTPEQICGLTDEIPFANQYARRLAEAGCQVFVPAITSRHVEARNGRSIMTDREFIYRSAFVLGHHVLGYELQTIFALVDVAQNERIPVGVIGYGEGGMLSLLAGALDPRISATAVSGYFGPREQSWQEPLERNVFGLLKDFGSAELAAMIAPRPLLVETANVPDFEFAASGGAPSRLTSPLPSQIQEETRIAKTLGAQLRVVTSEEGSFGSTEWLQQFVSALVGHQANVVSQSPTSAHLDVSATAVELKEFSLNRRLRQLQEMDRHNQLLLRESPFVRKDFFSGLDTSSVDAYQASVESYRDVFREDVIGRFDIDILPPNAHSRKFKETDAWTAYEIQLDVFQDVGAYGILLIPKDLKQGERRPVVVCQHGLEGRPLDTISNDHAAYHDYAAKLCEQGFITFAPQNIYIFRDQFRTLQRKANPLGKTLFSIMVPQHQQIVNWLQSQPFVDPNRIAFYGLSYGGKSAMRIPALVTDYCLSICSADFNEWVLKNASTRHNFSYVWYGEYEIFEWNLGRTFNYAEMAALICPRPFMVERGHFDGVGEDDWVGYEYGKVRHLYAAQLKLPERTAIEWFDGPHTINGKATFEFLHRHLQW
jgi:dienelactone hydrolase